MRGEMAHAERGRGLPLADRDRLDAAAPDLAEECRGVQGQRDRRRGQRIDAGAEHVQPKNTRNNCISSGVPWNTWM